MESPQVCLSHVLASTENRYRQRFYNSMTTFKAYMENVAVVLRNFLHSKCTKKNNCKIVFIPDPFHTRYTYQVAEYEMPYIFVNFKDTLF